ncbi:MAG: hypothetical protein IPH36_01830 [Saprospiraceae bacterium]|nr:hypothetical protein [Saprospiraceae bacterium]
MYTHDCYANAQYLFTADLSNGVGVYDISNRSDPKFLTRFQTPNVFAHNVWTNPEGTVLYTTDEVSGAYLASYDISDLNNVQFWINTEMKTHRSESNTSQHLCRWSICSDQLVYRWHFDPRHDPTR